MTERIDDLYKQARLDAGYEKGFEATVQDVYQRFAELIVRECIAQCNDGDSRWFIAQHFGVEE